MTVGLVIVSHSRQLAAGVVELVGQMAQGKTPIAAAGGTADDALGTSVEKILTAIQSVDSPDGVLVLLDLGSALLSAEMALESLDDEQRKRTQLSFAPLVEGAFAAALEASLGHTLAEVKLAAEKLANREQLQQLKPLEQAEGAGEAEEMTGRAPLAVAPTTQTSATQASGTHEVHLLLTNPTGLHARPASLFVQTAAQFQAKIEVSGHGRWTDAASIIGVLSLGLRQGDTITIRASGPDAQAAITALSELVRANFYETPSVEAPLAASLSPTISQNEIIQQGHPPAVPLHLLSVPQATHEPWRGISTSRGVAVGPAFLYTSSVPSLSTIERQSISAAAVPSEQERLRQALSAAAQETHTMATSLQSTIGQAQAAIFDAQALMLDDPSLLEDTLRAISEQHLDAASALASVGEQQATMLETLDDPLLAARAIDIRDAVSRAIQRLRPGVVSKQDLSAVSRPVILVASDLSPSDTARLRPETVLGICTVHGGPTAHAAILARALGIPAIAGLNEAALRIIHSGDELGLDADNGLLYHRPTPEVHSQLIQRLTEQQKQQTARKLAAQQAHTPISINGRRIYLLANVGSEAEAEAARQWGAEGIGLLRTEFLFANAPTLPGEDEQCQLYVKVFRAFSGTTSPQGRPIVVRTLDAGADKPMPALNEILGPTSEANPALGLRGIRIHLAHPTLLQQQLSALLRAAAETGVYLHVMFPMIATVEELQMAREIFDRVYESLEQVALPAHVPVGIMIEVPAAVIMARELAELADFFSIGANDLLQYTLACDRTNVAVSNLYHPMQPAVLRLIRQVAEAGRDAGRPVAVCGEIASDVRLAPLLVGSGVDELSMTPAAIPAVRTALTQRSSQELSDMAERISRLKTVAEVEQACTDFQI